MLRSKFYNLKISFFHIRVEKNSITNFFKHIRDQNKKKSLKKHIFIQRLVKICRAYFPFGELEPLYASYLHGPSSLDVLSTVIKFRFCIIEASMLKKEFYYGTPLRSSFSAQACIEIYIKLYSCCNF